MSRRTPATPPKFQVSRSNPHPLRAGANAWWSSNVFTNAPFVGTSLPALLAAAFGGHDCAHRTAAHEDVHVSVAVQLSAPLPPLVPVAFAEGNAVLLMVRSIYITLFPKRCSTCQWVNA